VTLRVDDATSIPELIAAHAVATPDAVPLVTDGERWTYREIWDTACAIAGGIRAAGVTSGAPVVIALPNGIDFALTFLGVLTAGATAVPVFPRSSPQRIGAIARATEAQLVVTNDPFELPNVRVETARGILGPSNISPTGREHLCYVQYTSGSTGEPRGVLLTNGCLLTNIAQMLPAMSIDQRDVFVSWLPTYHDMGLTLMLLTPLCIGARAVLLPTALKDVTPWLRAIEQHDGTFTAGPDFAYRLCIRAARAQRALLARPASLRVAMNASEPVRASTLQGFEEHFDLHRVMMTGYGLAEATLSVTCTERGAATVVDGDGLVCLGRPLPGVELELRDNGEILVGGPARCVGYLGGDSEEPFSADGFVRTGDRGRLDADGRLYFVGRTKDIIKIAGRTIAPQEIEEVVDAIPGVRLSAAISVDRGRIEGEQLVICAEARIPRGIRELEDLVAAIANELHQALGVRPQRTYLLKPRRIPLTENGKMRRDLLRAAALTNDLKRDDLRPH
jgi:fatty-acyl-CoA synthase